MVRTRFAPSPTGGMHPGNLRTALFNALFARRHRGRFLVRVEDTDAARSDAAHARALLADLRWLGLDWDDGPGCAEPADGARQSARGAVYAHWYERLQAAGRAYPCFCSQAELARVRRAQRAAGRPPRYPGTCARLDPADSAARVAAGEAATLRFRVPPAESVRFEDLVRGEQHFAADDLGDFVIRRADGSAAFLFCNALDDALMGVTHVLRGEDHLTNTPRQLLLLRALGLAAPRYGHLALIAGDDGAPLSKRNGSRSLQELREAGYLPLAIANYLARLGHRPASDELLGMAGLAQAFDIARLGRAPARFDPAQLERWQAEAVAATRVDELLAWLSSESPVPVDERERFVELVRPNIRFPHELRGWASRLFGQPAMEHPEILREAGAAFFAEAEAVVAEIGVDWQALTAALRERTGRGGRQLFLPLRVALTGVVRGPSLAEAAALMGAERVAARLAAARCIAASGPVKY